MDRDNPPLTRQRLSDILLLPLHRLAEFDKSSGSPNLRNPYSQGKAQTSVPFVLVSWF